MKYQFNQIEWIFLNRFCKPFGMGNVLNFSNSQANQQVSSLGGLSSQSLSTAHIV